MPEAIYQYGYPRLPSGQLVQEASQLSPETTLSYVLFTSASCYQKVETNIDTTAARLHYKSTIDKPTIIKLSSILWASRH